VDTCFELYGLYKTKRVAKGIPTIMGYYKGNEHYIPDDITVGSDEKETNAFFERCVDYLDNI